MAIDQTFQLESVLEIRDVRKSFGGNHVLRGLSFSLAASSITALIGSNGAGKSTFLNILSGLLPPDSGGIALNGHDLTSRPAYRRSRAGLARTFQHPRSFRSLSVLDAVLLARTPPEAEGIGLNLVRALLGASRRNPVEIAAARACLERCRLADRADTLAAELTYGDQKLLMLAQAISFDGEVYCFDELCAGLAPSIVDHVATIVLELGREGKTVLFVEHNLELIRTIADRSIFLHEGRVFRNDTTSAVLSDPDVVQLYLGD